MLLAREALFLRGGENPPVLDQGGGAVVIERRDAEDAHGSENRVDERRDGAGPAQREQQPAFLANPHENPELTQESHLDQ